MIYFIYIKIYKKTQHINLSHLAISFLIRLVRNMSDDEAIYISSDASVSDDEEDKPLCDVQQTKKDYNTIIDSKSLQKRVQELDDVQSDSVFIMTKYEYTRVKGERLQQLNSGAIPYVSYTTADTIEAIFLREFETGHLPLLVERKTPDGQYKFIKIRHFSNRKGIMFD